MSDEELRDLERRARDGDERAAAKLGLRWAELRRDAVGPFDGPRPSLRFDGRTLSLFELPGGARVVFTKSDDWRGDYSRMDIRAYQKSILDAARAANVRWVVADLARLASMQSSTLGALVRLGDGFRREGGDLVLVGLSTKQRIVLEMLGLNMFFQTFATRDDALIAILSGRAQPPGGGPRT